MIRIGLSRWFIEAVKSPAQRGQTEIALALIPQAPRYRVLMKQWRGLRDELVENEVGVEPIRMQRSELTYDLDKNPLRQVVIIKQLATEMAISAVDQCLRSAIVDCEGYDRAAGIWLVSTALMKNAERGFSDVPDAADIIDLVPDMRAIRDERQRQRQEHERMAREAYAAHLDELALRERERPQTKLSFELLYSLISPNERREAEETGWITIKSMFGEFRIPVAVHGLVRRYIEGQYEASYCVVFSDHTIPLGDECLMKIALLKTDPQRFLKTANRFVQRAA